MRQMPDGLLLIAKRACPTCALVEPLVPRLAAGDLPLKVYVQDDPGYASGAAEVVDEPKGIGAYCCRVNSAVRRYGGGSGQRW